MARKCKNKKIIGRIEKVDFPDWDLHGIDAKIDTGAYTSSLHCHHIESFDRNGQAFVRFNLLDPSHVTYNDKMFELPVHRRKTVKSSNGLSEERIVIKATLRIYNELYPAELSLTNRSEMKYPILIGRRFMKNRFLVDSAQKYMANKIDFSKESNSCT